MFVGSGSPYVSLRERVAVGGAGGGRQQASRGEMPLHRGTEVWTKHLCHIYNGEQLGPGIRLWSGMGGGGAVSVSVSLSHPR